jgi:hypothetical protein
VTDVVFVEVHDPPVVSDLWSARLTRFRAPNDAPREPKRGAWQACGGDFHREKPDTSSSDPGRLRFRVGTGGGCDPNYSGCLNPNATDYDCSGGSGDGPLYTRTVTVRGDDHYDLDADDDGIGCE